jgi:hypothetical protein
MVKTLGSRYRGCLSHFPFNRVVSISVRTDIETSHLVRIAIKFRYQYYGGIDIRTKEESLYSYKVSISVQRRGLDIRTKEVSRYPNCTDKIFTFSESRTGVGVSVSVIVLVRIPV